MRSRALKFKLLCGLQGCIPLDPTDLSEVDSAAEFIDIIDKFRTGIRKFNDRNPMITWNPSPTLREDTTLNDIIHDIVNSRKFMNFPNVESQDYNQVFELNFATETITLYSMTALAPHIELGSMHINTMFSNWKDIFYPLGEFYIVPFEDEDGEIEIINEEESLYDYMRPKMLEELGEGSAEFELWDTIMGEKTDMNLLSEDAYAVINYSGSGDSGDTDSFNFYQPKEDDPVPDFLGDVSKYYNSETTSKLYSAVWKLIDTREPGFYNNDGGYGEIIIGPKKFEWNHYNYITEIDHSVGMYHNLEEEDSIEEDMEITVMPLPESVEEALSAKAPEPKPEITLGDIVKEHHPAVYKSGSDHDIDLRLPF